MDWRNRKYYTVTFSRYSVDMRLGFIRLIDSVKITPYLHDIPKQKDECEERGYYSYLISIPEDYSDVIEYEFRKAERNDTFCNWKEIMEVGRND